MHLPKRFPFPTAGDLRWRGFFPTDQKQYVSMLQLRNADDEHLGDAVAYAEPNSGGRVLYVRFGLLNGPHAEQVLYDIFGFTANQLSATDN